MYMHIHVHIGCVHVHCSHVQKSYILYIVHVQRELLGECGEPKEGGREGGREEDGGRGGEGRGETVVLTRS